MALSVRALTTSMTPATFPMPILVLWNATSQGFILYKRSINNDLILSEQFINNKDGGVMAVN